MRILLTADPELPVPPRHYGGIERVIDLLAEGLRAEGFEVALAAHPDSTCEVDALFPWPGRASQRWPDLVRNMRSLAGAVGRFRPDVLHSFSRIAYMGPLLPRSLPKVMSYQRPPGRRSTSWASRIAGKSLVFTGCGEHICRKGRRGGGEWIAIPNAVELGKYPFVPVVPDDAPLVFLSRIERIKGTAEAMEAARRAGRRLIIAGNIPDDEGARTYWEREIKPRLEETGSEYIGPVDDEAKARLLGGAAAMLVPVQWDEPFGIVFAEALACGTPVISTPRGSLPEIIEEGRHGFLASDMDGWAEAIGRLDEIDRHECRRRAEECYSARVVVESYIRLYRRIASP